MYQTNRINDLDIYYGMKVIEDLSSPMYLSSPRWGGRNCGSDAEHRSAVYIANEMKGIGLSDISISPFIMPPIVKTRNRNSGSMSIVGVGPVRLKSVVTFSQGGVIYPAFFLFLKVKDRTLYKNRQNY